MKIGDNPFDRNAIKDSLSEFSALHANRPIKNNHGGMKTNHLFATWFMAKTLKPKTIIESGVWRGLGTWMLETACPESRIISLDLNLSKRQYISKQVEYHECDFSELDFRQIDTNDCLAFFDDHQNSLTRLQQCLWVGIKHVIFEDNHDPGDCDLYTMRMIFSGSGFGGDRKPSRMLSYNSMTQKLARRIFSTTNSLGLTHMPAIPNFRRDIIPRDNSDSHVLIKHLDAYHEFPPVLPTGRDNTEAPIFNEPGNQVPDCFAVDSSHYNHICYVGLKLA